MLLINISLYHQCPVYLISAALTARKDHWNNLHFSVTTLTVKTECHNPTSLFGSRTLIINSPEGDKNEEKKRFNPLSPKSDQHEISSFNINALENRVVMRIEYMIRENESNWYFNKFSPLLLLKKYRDSKWESQFWGFCVYLQCKNMLDLGLGCGGSYSSA